MSDDLTPPHWRHVRISPSADGETFTLVTFHCRNPFTQACAAALRLRESVDNLDLLSAYDLGEKIEEAMSQPRQ